MFTEKTIFTLLLMTLYGCSNQFQSITGVVINESGNGIGNVLVKACYSGWGWNNNGLVWDKYYCSEAVKTDNAGVYTVNFSGPDTMKLLAQKEGWLQTRDYWSSDLGIILTDLKTYHRRQAALRKANEEKFRTRLPDEANEFYYCRVILNVSRTVNLNYKGNKIIIFQNLLPFETPPKYVFAARGGNDAVLGLAREIVIRIDGKEVENHTSVLPGAENCQYGIRLIETGLPETAEAGVIEILVPSIRAMFDMYIWNQERQTD